MNASPSPEDLFHTARELGTEAEREAYLDEVCKGDTGLRATLEQLLAADLRATQVFGHGDHAPDRKEAAAKAADEVAQDLDRFRGRARGTEGSPQDSGVLHVLESRTGSSLRLQLDPSGVEGTPVKVTREARQLQDPSGRYQALGEIGHGGVGVVYKGRDSDLGRDVAIKVLRDEYSSRPDVLSRFVEEAQIGGQLQHPGIVPVYELGLQGGERPFIAMKLVKGETLSVQLLHRKVLTEDRQRFIAIFEKVCQTMHYAHTRNVIHRDLKPANVMIGTFGEVMVVDWGFAKVLSQSRSEHELASSSSHQASHRSVIETIRSESSSGSHSAPGSMMGTPAYMPPEQARGDIERLDTRSDVFGLGAILCEILTGEPPYRKEDGNLVQQAANAQLDGARQRLGECGADAELIALCIECLSPARAARPSSAKQVAERVADFQSSVEERARDSDLRAAEARYRQRTTLLASSGVLLTLILGTSGWLWWAADARARQDQAMERVTSARSVASSAHGQAQAAGLDPVLWATALSDARQVVELCSDEAVDQDTRAAAATQLAIIEREQGAAAAEARRRARDVSMLEQLELLRIPTDDDLRGSGTLKEQRRLDSAYADAFSVYLHGQSLFEVDANTALAALRSGDIATELAISFDHWGLVRDELEGLDPGHTARMRALASVLDSSDPWRTELRALLPLVDTEGERLKGLVDRADFHALSPASFKVLSAALWRAGQQARAIAALRRAQLQHPQDFDLSFSLALYLELQPGSRREEALAAYRIANALRPELGEVLHRQGLVLVELGRFAEAQALFQTLVSREPSRAHWYFHVAENQAHLGDHVGAIESYRKATEVDPTQLDSWVNLGSLLHEEGRLEESVDCSRRGLEVAPRVVPLLGNLCTTLSALGEYEDALANATLALELDPDSASCHYNLGQLRSAQGMDEAAIEPYLRAIDLDPYSLSALHNLGLAYEALGRMGDWVEHGERLLASNPDNAGVRRYLGKAYIASGRHVEAEECLKVARTLDPYQATVHHTLGRALKHQGKLEEASMSYQRALELDPQQAGSAMDLGSCFLKLGQLEDALRTLRRALEVDPDSASAYCGVGAALTLQGKLEDALSNLEQALVLDPDSAQALYWLGNLQVERGELDEAVDRYQQALQLDPANSTAAGNLGSVYAMQGEPEQAIVEWQRALELDPSSTDVLLDLARMYTMLEEPEEVVECYRRVLEIDPRDSLTHNQLGLALKNSGRTEEAIASYRSALEHDVEFAPAHFNLGTALAEEDRNTEAIASFEAALSIWAPLDDDFSVLWTDRTKEYLGPLYYNHGEGFKELGKLDEAIESYRLALAVWSPPETEFAARWSLRAGTYMGTLLNQQGRHEEATRSYLDALTIDPSSAVTLYNYGECLEEAVRLEEALAVYRRAFEIWASGSEAFSINWAAETEQRIEACTLQLKASPVLRGDRAPSSSLELHAAVALGYNQERYQEVVALCEAAALRSAELDEGIRSETSFYCARAAALLAAGDESKLLADERARMHTISRRWLMRAAEGWRSQLVSEEGADEAREQLDGALEHLDFEGVRGDALSSLPAAEQLAWQAAWDQVGSDVPVSKQ